MKMGGVTGSFALSGDGLENLYPLLALGQWLHAGKNTSFGLGQYRMSVRDSGLNG
jgi:CRISPR/Cas system endoribonuclease Cas6 (RAMP superfamily)